MKLSDGTIRDAWQWWEWRLGTCSCPAEPLAVARLRVTQESATGAVVDVVATLGSGTTIGGPMTLVRSGPGWVIHDYQRNGLDFASSISPRSAHRATPSVDVRVIGVERDPTGEEVWFRISNAGLDPISLDTFTSSSGAMKLTPWTYDPTIKDIGANLWMVTNLVWQTSAPLSAGRPLSIRLVFTDLVTGARTSVSLSTLS